MHFCAEFIVIENCVVAAQDRFSNDFDRKISTITELFGC